MIQSHTLQKAPRVAGVLQRYFGIDLAELPKMSDQQLAAIADRAQAMKRLQEILPILEQHFETLIQGQLAYEEFVQKVLKDGTAAGKKIDKALVDAFLMNRGYEQHQQLLQQKLGHETQKQDMEFRGQIDLNKMDMASWIRLFQAKQQQQAKQIQQKYPEGIRQLQQQEQQSLFAQQQRQQAMQRKELLTYGTQGNPKRRGMGDPLRVSLRDRVKSLFMGA